MKKLQYPSIIADVEPLQELISIADKSVAPTTSPFAPKLENYKKRSKIFRKTKERLQSLQKGDLNRLISQLARHKRRLRQRPRRVKEKEKREKKDEN